MYVCFRERERGGGCVYLIESVHGGLVLVIDVTARLVGDDNELQELSIHVVSCFLLRQHLGQLVDLWKVLVE